MSGKCEIDVKSDNRLLLNRGSVGKIWIFVKDESLAVLARNVWC